MADERQRRIWVDIDNTPHVLFFDPVIKALRRQGHEVHVTLRDALQIKDLAALKGVAATPIGSHFGQSRVMKACGTLRRAWQLARWMRNRRFDAGVSLGSRSQLLACRFKGVPAVEICDYEHAMSVPWIGPATLIAPDVIPREKLPSRGCRIVRLPGLKEDVYLPFMEVDDDYRRKLGVDKDDVLVVVRPPATEAHYHDARSERVFEAVVPAMRRQPSGARRDIAEKSAAASLAGRPLPRHPFPMNG